MIKNTFALRLISGVILIAVMFYLFIKGNSYLKYFIILTTLLIQWESSQLIFFKFNKSQQTYISLSTGVATVIGFYTDYLLLSLTSFFCFYITIDLFRTMTKNESVSIPNLFIKLSQLGLFIFYSTIIPSFAYLIFDFPQGKSWFLLLISTTLGSDTFAYFGGKLWGKHKLTDLSPNKTIEGSLAGLIGSVIIGVSFSHYFASWPLYLIVTISLVAGLLGQIGDLFESMLKRVANVKDSGYLIPGHGGILDRVDAIIFAAPWMYLAIFLLNRYQLLPS